MKTPCDCYLLEMTHEKWHPLKDHRYLGGVFTEVGLYIVRDLACSDLDLLPYIATNPGGGGGGAPLLG